MRNKDTNGIVGHMRWTVTDDNGVILRQSPWIKNLIPNGNTDTGVGLILQHLLGDNTNPLEITDGAIGTGSTGPTNADTALETETVRTTPSLKTKESATTVFFSFFFTNAFLANGTYTEFGLFANTKLFSRLLLNPIITKGTGENTTVDYRIEILNT